ncbi:AT-rich interactive domain-containing protein 1A-like [Scylla paramamosain]|uniref:AT-rich interactive domain-containing protein 1A-like n=1 Tax=Scylla paramamosain TaxID=85552 RepID=UPI003083994A
MEWTCNENCWCHIPVQKERGPPCYQCVIQNCSFTSSTPVPSAPPLRALLDYQEPSPVPHLYEEPNTASHLYSHPYEESSTSPHQHEGTSPPSHQYQSERHPSPSPPPLLPPKRNKLSIRCSWSPSTSNRLSLSSDPAPPDAAAAVRHTQEYSPSPPVAQARLEMEVPVLPGWKEQLQEHSQDGNVKKNEPTDVSGLLRELLVHDEDVTASQGAEAFPWVSQEENTSSTHSGNSSSATGSSAANFSDDNQDYRRKRRGRMRLSGFGLESNVLSQRHSMHATAHYGSLDEETFRRINKINRRESWKCAQQRHIQNNNKAYF